MSLAAASTVTADTFDDRLARSTLRGDPDAVDSAVIFFERNSPTTLLEATELLRGYGEISPQAFQRIDEAWTTYWHMRYQPFD